jgi:hypothetical protein
MGPFIQTGLLLLAHIFFQLVFKMPFFLYLRGFEYPKEYITNVSGFEEFLSGTFSFGILIISLIAYILL